MQKFRVGTIIKFKKDLGKIQDHLLITRIDYDGSLVCKVVKSVHRDLEWSFRIDPSQFDIIEVVLGNCCNFKREKVSLKYAKL